MPPPPTNAGKKSAAGAGAAAKGGASAAAGSAGPKSPTSRPETRGLPRLPDAFWCRQDIVKVKAGAPIKLNVQFLPFALGDHKCQLVLLDDQVGEFMIDFAGVASKPALIETFRWTIENRTSIPRDFPVPFRNAQVRGLGRGGAGWCGMEVKSWPLEYVRVLHGHTDTCNDFSALLLFQKHISQKLFFGLARESAVLLQVFLMEKMRNT